MRGDSFKLNPWSVPVCITILEPRGEVLTLAHVEGSKLVAALSDSLNANAGDTNAATHGEIFQRQQMEANTSQRRVGDRRAAK